MSTAFEPSLSTSIMRPPLASANALSMADSLPNINFGFDELRERMARFTDRFDVFIASGRQRVLDERNEFRKRLAEIEESQRLRKQELEIVAQTTSQHHDALSAQAVETAEMESAIASITERRDAHVIQRDNLKAEIKTIQKQVSQREAAQAAHERDVDAQAQLNAPELNFWETYLALRIESAGQVDRLKFVFNCVDERDWKREAWFELDTELKEYRVVMVRPVVGEGEVDTYVVALNESRDLRAFLKSMREVFRRAMR